MMFISHISLHPSIHMSIMSLCCHTQRGALPSATKGGFFEGGVEGALQSTLQTAPQRLLRHKALQPASATELSAQLYQFFQLETLSTEK